MDRLATHTQKETRIPKGSKLHSFAILLREWGRSRRPSRAAPEGHQKAIAFADPRSLTICKDSRSLLVISFFVAFNFLIGWYIFLSELSRNISSFDFSTLHLSFFVQIFQLFFQYAFRIRMMPGLFGHRIVLHFFTCQIAQTLDLAFLLHSWMRWNWPAWRYPARGIVFAIRAWICLSVENTEILFLQC